MDASEVNVNVNSKSLKKYMSVLYACKECNNVFHTKKDFYEHSLQHYIDKKSRNDSADVFLCSKCHAAFNTMEETRHHLKTAHQDEKNNRELPRAETTKAKQTKGKYKMRKKEKLSCPFKNCKVSFDKDADMEIHLKCHIEEDNKMFSCFECSLVFPAWPKCAMHLYKDHNVDCALLRCPACENYRAWAPLTLENHMRVHCDLKAFVCSTCGEAFKQASQLRNHNATHNTDPDFIRNKRKQCNACFKIYSDAKALKKHKDEVHKRLRPFVCNVCGHASARKHLLLIHQTQHTGQKTRTCDYCDFKTADHNSLRRHVMRHTGMRSYYCPECSFSTLRSSNYKQHVRRVHPTSSLIFICAKCSYKTVSEDNYVRHVSDHLTGLIKDPDGKSGESSIPEELVRKFPAWIADPSMMPSCSTTDLPLQNQSPSGGARPTE